jgi:hypothetical protein
MIGPHPFHMKNTNAMSSDHPFTFRGMRRHLVQSLVIQAMLLILASLVLDGGFFASIVISGIIVHWLVVAIMAVRRSHALTLSDAILIRMGYVLWSGLVVAGYIMAMCISRFLLP